MRVRVSMNAFLRGLRLLYGVVKRLHNLVDCNCIAGIKTRKQLRWNFTKYDEMRPGISNSLAISTCVANRRPQASVSRMSIDNVHIISMYSI